MTAPGGVGAYGELPWPESLARARPSEAARRDVARLHNQTATADVIDAATDRH